MKLHVVVVQPLKHVFSRAFSTIAVAEVQRSVHRWQHIAERALLHMT